MANLDMVKLRELAAEFGYYPATTDDESIERHRKHNANADFWLARSQRFDHLKESSLRTRHLDTSRAR